MNKRRGKILRIVVVAIVLVFAAEWVAITPRTRKLPNGYLYIYFPRGGHRYIVTPDGIKKVGQEVLEYHVNGDVIVGKVRRSLAGNDIRSFTPDTKSNVVTLDPPDP